MKTATNRFDGKFPFQVLLESTSACNLKCIMCARSYTKVKVGIMKEEIAYKLIDEIAKEDPSTRLWLCYFGEPLILRNTDILYQRIKYSKEKGIKSTIINTNGNLLEPHVSEKLMESGLDEIYIGIDAVTAETYSKIRVGGDYNKLMNNIDYLLKQGNPNLKVTVQFGIYESNEHEVEDFKKYWEEKGVKIFIRPKLTWIGHTSENYKTTENRYPCPWLFDTFAIDFDGKVPYCVCDWHNQSPVGDLNKETIKEVWQNRIREYQAIHLRKEWDKLPEFCQNCRDWQTKPYADYLKNLKDIDGNVF